MWAQQLIAPRRFATCELRDPPVDSVPDGHVVLRVRAAGICGSDLVFFRGMLSPDSPGSAEFPERPGFPIHEVVGTVVHSRHPEIELGDDVVGWASRFDGIAEYVVSDGEGLQRYDAALSPAEAVTIQPLACVMYAVDQISLVAGRRAAVIGQGPIGLLFSHVLKTRGAASVTGVDPVDRRDVAGIFQVNETVTAPADRWLAQLDDVRPELVIEAVGHQTATLNNAVAAVAPFGEIYYFGIPDELAYPFNLRLFLRKDLSLRSGVTRRRRHWLAEADRYLREHPELRKHYVTNVLPANQSETTQMAFELAVVPRSGQAKIVLEMSQ